MRTSQTQTILSRLAGSILDNRRPACRCELLTCLMMMTTVCDVLKCDPTTSVCDIYSCGLVQEVQDHPLEVPYWLAYIYIHSQSH